MLRKFDTENWSILMYLLVSKLFALEYKSSKSLVVQTCLLIELKYNANIIKGLFTYTERVTEKFTRFGSKSFELNCMSNDIVLWDLNDKKKFRLR